MDKAKVILCLDLQAQDRVPVIQARRGDTARTLEIHLSEGNRPYALDPQGYAVLTGRKPDGSVLYNPCKIQDNAVFYDFTEQTASCAGRTELQLQIYGGDQMLLTTAHFYLQVEDALYTSADAAKSQDEQTVLNDLVNRTLDVKNSTESLKNTLEEKWRQGELTGESAYETAVRLGYPGTESQWLHSLHYDHSPEFTALAAAVQQNAGSAEKAAENAEKAASLASEAQKIASTDAAEIREKAKQTETYAEQILDSFRKGDQTYSNTLSCRVSGREISVTDVSPLPHRIHGRVYGLQLLPFPYELSSGTISGVTFTVNEDGSILAEGTAQETIYFTLTFARDLPEDFFSCPMFLSGNPVRDDEGVQLRLWGMSKTHIYRDLGHGVQIPENLTRFQPEAEFDLYIAKGTFLNRVLFRPMVNYGEKALPFMPPRLLEGMQVQLGPDMQTVICDRFGKFSAESEAPSMNCTAPGPDLLVSMSYNRDINSLEHAVYAHTEERISAFPSRADTANALTRTVQGEVIAVDDMSPLEHPVICTVSGAADLSAVKVYCRNAQMLESKAKTETINGVTFTVQTDKTIIADGTASADIVYSIIPRDMLDRQKFVKGRYELTGCPQIAGCELTGSAGYFSGYFTDIGSGASFELKEESGMSDKTYPLFLEFKAASGTKLQNAVIKPMIKFITISSDYQPFAQVVFKPSPEGTISGMTSLPGAMTILSNTPGVTIEAIYNQNTIIVNQRQNDRIAVLENLMNQKLGGM